jgi:hypothetical protein
MDCVEFYKTQKTLASGTYQITEHDGEINYAVVDRYSNVKWYSQREYDLAIEQGIHDQDQDARLDAIMRFDDDDLDEQLMESWDIAMHRQDDTRKADEIAMADHDEFRRVDAHDFANDDDRVEDEQLIVEMSNPGKTLGELLRESMSRPDSPIQSMLLNERPIIEDDGNGLEVEHESEDVTEAEFEQHKVDLGQFMQTSSVQLDHSMANKPADLGDLL